MPFLFIFVVVMTSEINNFIHYKMIALDKVGLHRLVTSFKGPPSNHDDETRQLTDDVSTGITTLKGSETFIRGSLVIELEATQRPRSREEVEKKSITSLNRYRNKVRDRLSKYHLAVVFQLTNFLPGVNHVVPVHWKQRGAGDSLFPVPIHTLPK